MAWTFVSLHAMAGAFAGTTSVGRLKFDFHTCPPELARRRRGERPETSHTAAVLGFSIDSWRAARASCGHLYWGANCWGLRSPSQGNPGAAAARVGFGAKVRRIKSKFYGTMPVPPLDGTRTAASSPRDDLVKNARAHPTH